MFTWDEDGYEIELDQVHDGLEGLHAEVSIRTSRIITDGKKGHVHWARLNLSSTTSRTSLVTHLSKTVNTVNWREMLEYTCTVTAQQHRMGAPVLRLRDVPERRNVEYLIKRLAPIGQTTIIYGKGGGAKGWMASLIGLAVCQNQTTVSGIAATQAVNVLYLDWEADEYETRRRVGWVSRGLGMTEVPDNFFYRNMERPLVDDARTIRKWITDLHIGLVILDSLVPATSDEAEKSNPARQLMGVLRTFQPATRLAIGHMTKAESRTTEGEGSEFGSIFYRNLSRSSWEFRCSNQTATGVDIALLHRKVNSGPLQEPFGFRLGWDDVNGTAVFTPAAVDENPTLAAHQPLSWRIRQALRHGQRSTVDLAEELGETENAIRAECGRMRDVMNFETRKGPGVVANWGMVARNEL